MAKKKTEEKINLDSILFKCRDILRKARNSGSFFEKRDMMLTLVFLRFIGEKFEDGVEKLRQDLIAQGLDPDDENIIAAFFDDATFTDGTYNLPVEARWSTIINTPAPKLNVALDTALHSIATSSQQLKGCFVEGTFTTRNLAPNDIKQVVDEVNKISHKAFGEEKDLIGRVYEYFLKEFAVNATKEEGEYYTPHDVVQLIAAMIEPFDGTSYDPCCGSGGMFVQSADLIREKRGDISRINVYGQDNLEKKEKVNLEEEKEIKTLMTEVSKDIEVKDVDIEAIKEKVSLEEEKKIKTLIEDVSKDIEVKDTNNVHREQELIDEVTDLMKEVNKNIQVKNVDNEMLKESILDVHREQEINNEVTNEEIKKMVDESIKEVKIGNEVDEVFSIFNEAYKVENEMNLDTDNEKVESLLSDLESGIDGLKKKYDDI